MQGRSGQVREEAVFIDKSNQSFTDGQMQEFEKRAMLESNDIAYIEHNIMQMFYKSPFYEEGSDNDICNMQSGEVRANWKDKFENMTGV